MARESVFSRKRKEKGKDWLKVTNPNELIKMSESILSDIAYGNLSSNEDKWTMVDPIVQNAILSFASERVKNLYYLANSMHEHRAKSTEQENVLNSVLFENIMKSYDAYNCVVSCLNGYLQTQNPTYMINMYAKLSELKNYICPGRFI